MSKATLDRPKRTTTKAPKPATNLTTFRSAVNYLDSLVNHERNLRVQYDSNNFGIDRAEKLLDVLGNPHLKYKTVHIAGTKGKGSTATMLAEMLRANGTKVGLYTSPHVMNLRERIRVDGNVVPDAAFTKAISAVEAATKIAGISNPTYFDVLTAAAFLHFAEVGVEVAVIETGLGGRLDATNVVKPDAVGITSISYDHMLQLGSKLTSIAKEKAGIIKQGIPIVSAPQEPEVYKVLKDVAELHEAPIRVANEGVDFSYRFEFSRGLGRHARICLTTQTSRFEHVHVPLLGEHQAINCAIALGLLDTLKTRGLDVDDHRATSGLSEVKLVGRMQMISEEPRIIVDGAHNAQSVTALVRAIGQNISYDSMVVIFGCSRDKDVVGMVREIQYGADKIIFTKTKSPRSADPIELAAEFTEQTGKMAQVSKNLEDAIRIALGAITREDLICITGSFYLVSEAIRKAASKSKS